jgi:probable HAF family extracellular repeat protein
MRVKTLSLSLIAAGLLAQPALAQRSTTDALGFLPGGGTSYAYAINSGGQVVGYASTSGSSGNNHAFLWSSGGGMQDLGTLGGALSYANAINAGGQVAGYSSTGSNSHAFLWTSGGGMVDLGTLGGSASYANAINAGGQVAGYSYTSSSTHAFLWSSGVMKDLGTLTGGGVSYATALNAGGQVAGYSSTGTGYHHAFHWSSGGGMVDLGTLGGNSSSAHAINATGQVAGYSTTSSGANHAFLWTSGGGMQDLGTLGGSYSFAYALNASGQVVGTSAKSVGSTAFLWNAGKMHDLNSVAPAGWTFNDARGINDLAQVVGYGFNSGSGSYEAYRLTLHPDWQAGNGSWSSAANWNFAGMGSFGITPGLPHDVVINPSASATVSGPSNATVNSLTILGNGDNLVTLNLNSGSVTTVNGTTLGNNATVTGSGRLAGNLGIDSGGRVLVGNGQSMQLAGKVANGGRIDAQSTSSRSSLEVGGALINAAGSEVNLMNADVYAHGGTTNAGRMSLYGLNTLFGAMTNQSGGQVNVSGPSSEAVFWDNFVNNGAVSVTAGSTATFFGLVSGGGSFLGDGTKHFAGNMAPGLSPGLMTMGGSIVFSGGALTMELGGLVPGSGHDKIVFLSGSTVTLAGIGLNVEYWGGWTAAAGQTYDLFDWNGLSGTFSSVALPALASGLAWNTSNLYTSGEISVAAVPEPGTWMMLFAGLGLLGVAARRKV